ncbi:MAG: IS21 family transposase [Pseudomonadota bacterium]
MDQYEFIRTAHRVYGKNITELARQTGHSRNTIKKAIHGEPWGYKDRQSQPSPVLGPYQTIIDEWLKKDQEQPKKQRHTGRRVFNRLVVEHGFTGCESSIRRYVRQTKIELGLDVSCQVFIPCEPDAGREAEVDWGSATAVIAGESLRLKFFCMRSKFSGKHFVRFYPCERQQAFFDGHIKAFEFFGGIFPVLIYDNLTTAVLKVMQGRKRLEQENFRKFRTYYSFEARFCNPASGNEKGGVEGLVGFARRNYMVPVPEASSIDELNEKILMHCLSYGSHTMAGRVQNVESLYGEEKSSLLLLPEAVYSNVQPHDGRADKYATVMVDKNRYSIPWRYVGQKLKILLHVDQVDIYAGLKRLATHERLFGNNKWSLHPDHYLELIQRRPMSFNSARPIRQWREHWPKALHRLLACFCCSQGDTKGIKDFISVLMLYKINKPDEVEVAIELALEKNISTSDGVRHILMCTHQTNTETPPLAEWSSLPRPNVAAYGALGGVQ